MRITIVNDFGYPYEVDAEAAGTSGDFAVHADAPGDERRQSGWTVTHVPSGLSCVTGLGLKSVAVRAAAAFDEVLRERLSGVRRGVPTDVGADVRLEGKALAAKFRAEDRAERGL